MTSNITKKEELEYYLNRIKQHILNCKYDLNGMFKGNVLVINKLKKLEEQEIEIIKQIEELDDE